MYAPCCPSCTTILFFATMIITVMHFCLLHVFTQGILENAIKITNEPPTGMHANLHSALDNFDQVSLQCLLCVIVYLPALQGVSQCLSPAVPSIYNFPPNLPIS